MKIMKIAVLHEWRNQCEFKVGTNGVNAGDFHIFRTMFPPNIVQATLERVRRFFISTAAIFMGKFKFGKFNNFHAFSSTEQN